MSSAPARPLELDDLLDLSSAQLREIMAAAHPIDPDAMAGKQYLGSDLSLPKVGQRILADVPQGVRPRRGAR